MSGVIIVLKRGADRAAFLARCGALDVRPFEGLPRHFRVAGATPEDFPLRGDPAIELIEPDDLPARPCAGQQVNIGADLSGGNWALLRMINRDPPWNTGRVVLPIAGTFECYRTGKGVDIYVMDTGFEVGHAEFGGRATNVYEFFSSGGAGDDVGHGTSCAGAAAGATVGLARDALLFSFKIGQAPTGNSTNTALTTAIGELLTHYNGRAALDRPAVCSISYTFSSASVLSAIADMIDAGIVMLGAAGNDMTDLATIDAYPAEATDAVCVGGIGIADIPYYRHGVGANETLLFGTNFGTPVDILAPAQSMYISEIAANGSYSVRNGTSFACPTVAGVVACMLQGYRRLTSRGQVQNVKSYLLAQATTGRLRSAFGLSPLADKIAYLDPGNAPPRIVGLTGLARPENFSLPPPVLRPVGTADPAGIGVPAPAMGAPGVTWPQAFGVAGSLPVSVGS